MQIYIRVDERTRNETRSSASQTCFLNIILASRESSGKSRTLTQNGWHVDGRLKMVLSCSHEGWICQYASKRARS